MEDWDCNYACSESESAGKIFGSRGRGFLLTSSRNQPYKMRENTQNDSSVILGSINEVNYDHEGSINLKTGRGFNDKRIQNSNNRNNSNNNLGQSRYEDTNKVQKPKSRYIPEAPTEDESEIFGNTISSGINFGKYDDIEVKVTGENPIYAINSFSDAGLRPFIVDIIKKCGYTKPTPIQKFSIPIVMNGRDMMACAQTGSGKTAAFLIPIINNLLENQTNLETSICKPQAVIISPTRELAIQIFNEARKFSRGTNLKVALNYGGTSIYHQIEAIKNGCHILVATPGRLLDFVRRNLVTFSKTTYLVLDEADRLLDLGFLPEIKRLMEHNTMLPSRERQTLMFSATFPEEIQRLAEMFLNNYLFVAVGIVGGACSDVEQRFFSVTKFNKRDKLVELLRETQNSKCLVFVEQKRTTDFIATFLCEKNFPATSIHGDREQREREEALNDFKNGKMNILVATSVAARGLNIKNVAHVLNFDLPNTIDEYVHRIGRTGRVGNRGLATSFFDPNRDSQLAPSLVKILKQTGQEVPEFLREIGEDGVVFDVSSDFGGKDYRKNNFGSAKEFTFEDEVW